jgi:hypothetical protein
MSFASSFGQPLARTGLNLLRGSTIQAIARTVGVVAAAGLLGAVYHVVNDEARNVVQLARLRGQYRRHRHDRILVATLGTALDPQLQYQLLSSRDAFKRITRLLVDPAVDDVSRNQLRQAIVMACSQPV